MRTKATRKKITTAHPETFASTDDSRATRRDAELEVLGSLSAQYERLLATRRSRVRPTSARSERQRRSATQSARYLPIYHLLTPAFMPQPESVTVVLAAIFARGVVL